MATDLSTLNTQIRTRFIHSGMVGSPSLTVNRGDLVKLLKIVLVDGFNSQTASGITYDSTTNIATINFSSNPGFIYNQVVQVSGTDQNEFNNTYRVLEANSSYIKVKCTNNPPPTGTGTITVKVSPLGYDLIYNDIANTGIACFKNKSTKYPAVLKVIDALPPNGYNASWSYFARVVAGTAIDSNGKFINNEKVPYNDAFPYQEETGNGVSGASGIHSSLRWDYALPVYESVGGYQDTSGYGKGTYPTRWKIIGDDKTFYLFIKSMGAVNSQYNICIFGNINTFYESNSIYIVGTDGNISADTSYPYQAGSARRNSFTLNNNNTLGLYLFKTAQNKIVSWNNFRNFGLSPDTSTTDYPSRSTNTNGISSVSGNIFTSPIYIKDMQGEVRGIHRGIEQFYGLGVNGLSDMMQMNNGDSIVLTTKYFEWNSGSSNTDWIPYLFTLKDWPDA